MFEAYTVGSIYPQAKGHMEGCYFDISDVGGTLLVYFDHPTKNEKEAFKMEERFELRMITMSDIMMFLVKFGSLNWMDAPYNPHLSKNLSGIQREDGKGLAVTIMMFDTSTGRLESLRLVSLSERMTDEIRKAYKELMARPFERSDYNRKIALIFGKYSTTALVKMAGSGFRIN